MGSGKDALASFPVPLTGSVPDILTESTSDFQVVVQLENERFVSGHRFSDAARCENAGGLSRWVLAALAVAEAGPCLLRGMPEDMP